MPPKVDEKLVEVMIKNAQNEEKYVALHTRFDKFEENINTKLDTVIEGNIELGKCFQDHESRIASLEENKKEVKEEMTWYRTTLFKILVSGTAGGVISASLVTVGSKLLGI